MDKKGFGKILTILPGCGTMKMYKMTKPKGAVTKMKNTSIRFKTSLLVRSTGAEI